MKSQKSTTLFKYLCLVLFVCGCSSSKLKKQNEGCVKFKQEVLLKAVRNVDDTYFFLAPDEKAVKLLNQYTTDHYVADRSIKDYPALTKKCNEDMLDDFRDKRDEKRCDYQLEEMAYFTGVINSIKLREWKKTTFDLAWSKLLQMLYFHTSHPTSFSQMIVVVSLMDQMADAQLLPKKKSVVVKELMSELEAYGDILRETKSKEDPDDMNCKDYIRSQQDLDFAETIRMKVIPLLPKIEA